MGIPVPLQIFGCFEQLTGREALLCHHVHPKLWHLSTVKLFQLLFRAIKMHRYVFSLNSYMYMYVWSWSSGQTCPTLKERFVALQKQNFPLWILFKFLCVGMGRKTGTGKPHPTEMSNSEGDICGTWSGEAELPSSKSYVWDWARRLGTRDKNAVQLWRKDLRHFFVRNGGRARCGRWRLPDMAQISYWYGNDDSVIGMYSLPFYSQTSAGQRSKIKGQRNTQIMMSLNTKDQHACIFPNGL